MAEEKRSSYVEKKLEFVVNVGNYESLRIGTTFGETILWSSAEERQKKLDALTKSVAKEVAKDAQEVMLAYGLKRISTSQHDHKGKEQFQELNDIADSEEDEDIEL